MQRETPMKAEMLLFEKAGPQNTDETLAASRKRAGTLCWRSLARSSGPCQRPRARRSRSSARYSIS